MKPFIYQPTATKWQILKICIARKNLIRGLLLPILLFPLILNAQQLAFPSAEGFGRFATGGRGGEVYHVTNLNDSGPGSFRDAVSQPNRTVVFDVGGVIRINARIIVSPNITIAGQTAPGDGIAIYGNGLSYSNANNTITRHIRIRMGRIGDSGADAIAIAEGHDMIFDHVSVSWGRDGTFDINGDVGNVTLQNSIIGQGLQTHSTGGLIQSTGGVSILRCLYIDNQERNPKVKGVNQYVNNVVYNWIVSCYILGDSEGLSYANVQNNYFIDGPETGDTPPFNRANENFNLFAENNWHDANENGVLDGAIVPLEVYGPVTWVPEPFDYPEVTMLSPLEAYSNVVENAGASLHRDEVDAFMINELTSLGTLGHTISDEMELPTQGPGLIRGGPAQTDTDADGMPDYWEEFMELDINNPDDGNMDKDADGYTNLEEYLNCLAGECDGAMPPLPPRKPATFTFSYDNSGNHSWDWFNNWDLGYVPAEGDTAIILEGEAQVNHDIPGVIVKVKKEGSLNITANAIMDSIVLDGGNLTSGNQGTIALTADLVVTESSEISAGNSEEDVLTLYGSLSGAGSLTVSSPGKLKLENEGEHFSGDWFIPQGKVTIDHGNPLGAGQVNISGTGYLETDNAEELSIAFLYIKENGKLNIHKNYEIPGGKLGNENLQRNHKYSSSSHPDFIEGSGVIRISNTGDFDCHNVWNGTAYEDDCQTCVGGVTERSPCYTDLQEGVYSMNINHSGLCVALDEVLRQDSCSIVAKQAWTFTKAGNFYKISSLKTGENIAYADINEDTILFLTDSSSQNTFRLEKIETSYHLTPALAPDLLVSVENASFETGAKLVLNARTGTEDQQFSFTPYVDCNGDPGGLAEVDDCGICSGGNTGFAPCKGSLQAEEFCALDGVTETTNGGYTGESYINFNNFAGAKVTYYFVSDSARAVAFNLRYAIGSSGSRDLEVLVNGETQVERLEMPSTNDWTNWRLAQATVVLDTGYNVLTFEALSSDGGPNLDIITYSATGISAGDCSIETDCNGVISGTAEIDNCGICAGGNTGIEPCAGAIQAEEFCSLDGVTETTNGGFLGDSYINFDNSTGTSATYYIVSDMEQPVLFNIRYANGGSGSRNLAVVVNGETQINTLEMPSTGGWTNWILAEAVLSLAQGYNVITFEALSSSGGPNLDMFSHGAAGVSLGDCNAVEDCNGDLGGTAFIDDCGICAGGNTGVDPNACTLQANANLRYYPNSFSGALTVEYHEPFSYTIYDIYGQLKEQGQCEGGQCKLGKELTPDLYILKIINKDLGVVNLRIVKK